jgi:hypothetical protein
VNVLSNCTEQADESAYIGGHHADEQLRSSLHQAEVSTRLFDQTLEGELISKVKLITSSLPSSTGRTAEGRSAVVCQLPAQQQQCLNLRGAAQHLLQPATGGGTPAAHAAGTAMMINDGCLVVELCMRLPAAANLRSPVHHTCTK